jgi:hypothetical protein
LYLVQGNKTEAPELFRYFKFTKWGQGDINDLSAARLGFTARLERTVSYCDRDEAHPDGTAVG